MKITAEPRSDQWNADDFVSGPKTFTIAGVRVGTAEQKYDIDLVEGGGRSWRPPLTVLRILLNAWGDEAATWTGRRVTLFRDPDIRFGKDAVGGIRISHMSHIDKKMTVALTTTRGKRGIFTVEPLPDATPPTPEPSAEDVAACMDQEALRAMWHVSGDERRAQITARVNELRAQETPS